MKLINWKLARKQASNMDLQDRKVLVEGSAGSGKTIYAVHKSIKYALEHPRARIGVFRDTLPALKVTAWFEIKEALENYGIPFKENKSALESKITLMNGSIFFFRSLDNLKKIRSLNLDFIWVEQAEEIEWETYAELEKRLRGRVSKKDYGQLLLTVTPEQKTHWIYDYFHRQQRGKILHFHYTNNPFLPAEYVAEYEELKDIDYELYVKYTLGEWGTLSNIVYEKWDTKNLPGLVKKWTGGVDFGYNNPSVFLLIGWYDGEPYITKEVYRRQLTTTEFLKEITNLLREHGLEPHNIDTIYCDSSEPDRIEEFRQAGYNSQPGTKKFTERIDKVKRVQLHISSECIETTREIRSYKFRKDKDGNVLDKPVDKFDHAMDAMGYAIYGEIGDNTGNPFTFTDKRYEFTQKNKEQYQHRLPFTRS